MINVNAYDESLNDIYTYDQLLVYISMNLLMGQYRTSCTCSQPYHQLNKEDKKEQSTVTITISNKVRVTALDIEDPRLNK